MLRTKDKPTRRPWARQPCSLGCTHEGPDGERCKAKAWGQDRDECIARAKADNWQFAGEEAMCPKHRAATEPQPAG